MVNVARQKMQILGRINLTTKQIIGLAFLVVLLALFISFSRFPKLDEVASDLEAVTKPVVECFQGFCLETEKSLFDRWKDFSIAYFEIISAGMLFAFLVAGLTETFILPKNRSFNSPGLIRQTFVGLTIGPIWNLCSACVVPIANSFHRRGSGTASAIAMIQGSSTLNMPALLMALTIFTPLLGLSRIILSFLGALIISPLVAVAAGEKWKSDDSIEPTESNMVSINEDSSISVMETLRHGLADWVKASFGYLVRLGPIMLVAGLASGLFLQWITTDSVSMFLGNNFMGIIVAATLGILINVPLLFEIPLVALLIIMGMGTAPAATLLYVAAAGGPITFWGLSKVMPKKAIATFAMSTWETGVIGGLVVKFISLVLEGSF